MQMFNEETKSPHYRPLCEAKNFRAVTKAFDMEADLDAWIQSQQAKGYPADLDTLPRKAGEEAQQQLQQQEQQNLGKRKLKEEGKENTSSVSNGDASNGTEKQDATDTPAAKRHAADTATDTPHSNGDVSKSMEVDKNTLLSAGAEQVPAAATTH
jgi:tRNA-dihydrouridine synthase 2